MYNHPLTSRHLEFLESTLGYHIIPPVYKVLACGDQGSRLSHYIHSAAASKLIYAKIVGIGAMALVEQIVAKVLAECSGPIEKVDRG